MILQIVIRKWILWPLEGRHKLNSLGFFFVLFFVTKKGLKSMTILGLIFNKRIICRKWYLFMFDTKIIIFPRKVRHVLPTRDVWFLLAAKYLYIDIFHQKLRKVWIFSVSLLYVLSSCKVFSPVWSPPAEARWERKQDIQGSPPEVALEGDWTAD